MRENFLEIAILLSLLLFADARYHYDIGSPKCYGHLLRRPEEGKGIAHLKSNDRKAGYFIMVTDCHWQFYAVCDFFNEENLKNITNINCHQHRRSPGNGFKSDTK